MNIPRLLTTTRRRAGLTLRELAWRAETSHSTLSAYENGRASPTVATATRILAAAGFEATVDVRPRPGGPDPAARGRELADVLELAAAFPARHAPRITYPRFGAAA